MEALFITVFAALFSVVNPLGAMPVFLSMTTSHTNEERKIIALRASTYFVVILMVSFFVGIYVLSFFGIGINSMRIAGGIIIFLSGYALLYGRFSKNRKIDRQVREEVKTKDDISLTPLAIPLLSGPGSISLLIGLFAEIDRWQNYLIIAGVIITVGIVTYTILVVSPRLVPLLGASGMNSISRILGFIVMAIGVEYVATGVLGIYSQL